MRILIATDTFPPVCGGSGWSTYELARGLRLRGHHVVVVQPVEDGAPVRSYDGFDVLTFAAPAPSVPFVRNYARNERLYERLAGFFRTIIRRERIDLVHGQHVLTCVPAVRAAQAEGIPSVCTIRDYWPVCYWGDLLRNDDRDPICPLCSAGAMVSCLQVHAGAAWPVALPAIPYMRANLQRKQEGLSGASTIVAVSRSVAADLRERAPELRDTRIEAIPNAVDVARVRRIADAAGRPMASPYVVFVGKLARNKGVDLLIEVVQRADIRVPLVVAGDGPERSRLEAAAAAAGRTVQVLGWIERDHVFRWLRHAHALVFPSRWKEPLSRVLIEASALGAPIAAMDTGGTADVVVHGETGLLSQSAAALAVDVARLASDDALRTRLSAAAASLADALFDVPVVLARVEKLYEELIAAAPGARDRRV
jgi:glycosyltransferase involved in cell wall biosynthesis